MGIYNTSGVTESIGAVRYVEDKKTVAISPVYVVEGGVTKLVFEDSSNAPTGDTYYLYNRGTLSEVLGGFTCESDSLIYEERDGFLAITAPVEVDTDGWIISNRAMDLSAYSKVCIEYDVVHESTGEYFTSTSYGNRFCPEIITSDGELTHMVMAYSGTMTFTGERSTSDFIRFTTSGTVPMHDTYDTTLRIYSIWVEK